jgi:serine protease
MEQQKNIIFRFRPGTHVSYGELAARFQRSEGIWDSVKQLAPGCELKPRFSQLKSDDLNLLIEKARSRATMGWGARTPVSLESFSRSYVLRCPSDGALNGVVNKLIAWDQIERAYISYEITTPAPPSPSGSVNQGPNPLASVQFYLDAQPYGINARYAWTIPGGAGQGQDFVDLEGGWKLDHEDFRPSLATTPLLYGVNNIANSLKDLAHGTNALGVVCAEDNTKGGIGIVPRLHSINVVSHNMSSADLPEAILTAVLHLSQSGMGGVLLIEAQLGHPPLPVEVDDDVYEAILTATNAGVVVVEPAGNAGLPLDGLLPDSGAIMVASASQVKPPPVTGLSIITPPPFVWERRSDSNYGERINCFAWGENVLTTHSTAANPKNDYLGNFSGTSSASAIIAGAALSVQGMATAHYGHAFTPLHLRALMGSTQIKDGFQNTLPARTNPWIGVMPNLQAIRKWF